MKGLDWRDLKKEFLLSSDLTVTGFFKKKYGKEFKTSGGWFSLQTKGWVKEKLSMGDSKIEAIKKTVAKHVEINTQDLLNHKWMMLKSLINDFHDESTSKRDKVLIFEKIKVELNEPNSITQFNQPDRQLPEYLEQDVRVILAKIVPKRKD